MNISVNIDENRIVKMVEQEIASCIVEQYDCIGNEAGYGIKEGVSQAVKEYVYVNKDMIVEKVVNKATIEIVKKGLPKLVEHMLDEKAEKEQ